MFLKNHKFFAVIILLSKKKSDVPKILSLFNMKRSKVLGAPLVDPDLLGVKISFLDSKWISRDRKRDAKKRVRPPNFVAFWP